MPVVDVELVTDEVPSGGLASTLADVIGAALGARTGGTWVRLRALPRTHYGESGGRLPDDLTPVFVSILERHRPSTDDLADAAARVTRAVAEVTGVPAENVHVLFHADGAGRMSFGGRLVESD